MLLVTGLIAPLVRLLPGEAGRYAFYALLNWYRRRFGEMDYILLNVPTRMPLLPEERKFWQRILLGDPPLSLLELDRYFERIAEDQRVKGVILYLRDLKMPLADVQTLRDSILALRQRGKRVIVFAHGYDLVKYYVASAADDIVLQKRMHTGFRPLGLSGQVIFMRDALDAIGLKADVVQITPYKNAFDALTHREITPETREQLDWLFDSRFEMLVQGIAAGREMTPDAVHAMIDASPMPDIEARQAGYVDALCNIEDLPEYLQTNHIVPWEKAIKLLPQRWQGRPRRVVAVLPVSGIMIEGESRKPPADVPAPLPIFNEELVGHLTVVNQVRSVMQDERTAAVVLVVDSGGGDASAAEAMTSALRELAQEVPLVVYMGGMAASGGYYVATPARWIVAQPGSMTGSIGVISAKVVNSEMLKKLRFNAYEFTRGANAALESPLAPWTAEQRAQLQHEVEYMYNHFVELVSEGRDLTIEAVDNVGGGRVWTGAQALEHGLVDQLGNLQDAIDKARELANVPRRVPAAMVTSKPKPLGPQLAERVRPAAGLHYLRGNLERVLDGRPHMLLPLRFE